MKAKNYQQKRKFNVTPEPIWKVGNKNKSTQLKFVIQKHAARRLHYDFRLELDGVLKSWAIPKGPSLDPDIKRLAVEVEDHPLAYAKFEGFIPKGEYGGGEVIVWDNGIWEPLDPNPIKSLEKGHLKFKLHGKKLQGEWLLFRTAGRNKEKPQWLLRKLNDDAANKEIDVTEHYPESVMSGKLLDIDQTSPEPIKQSKRKSKLISSKIIKWPEPQLATLVDQLPNGADWIYEIKYDGYRILAEINAGNVTLYTRRHNDWTLKFESIADALKNIAADYALLDGEVVVLNDDGVSDFQSLQNALSKENPQQLNYFIFDLLQLNEESLINLPLIERKKRLEQLLQQSKLKQQIHFSEHFSGAKQGQQFYKKACTMHLEGVMAKQANEPYLFGRHESWLKVKCIKRQEFVIAGFTAPQGERQAFGALLVGFYDQQNNLHYAGKVGTGFKHEDLTRLLNIFKKYIQTESPFINPPKNQRHVTWLKPRLIAEIQFSEWTQDKRLRAPSFRGLREDKPAIEIKREQEKKLTEISSNKLEISNPSKIFFPDIKLTKLQLAQYYEHVAEKMLPHLQNRPVYILRCPDGINHQCFFQKHLAQQVKAVKIVEIKKTEKNESSFIIENKDGLVNLVQLGAIEFHIWNENFSHIGFPDQLTFDLDPDPNIKWHKVIETAFLLKDILEELNLISFVKTTGGKGLHITVPIQPIYSWQLIHDFAKATANTLTQMNPNLYLANASKEKRKNKIFIDYMRNNQGATIIAPYSVRARIAAPIATPLSWQELNEKIYSDNFNVNNINKRLAKLKTDPWHDFFQLKQVLSKKILKLLKHK